MISGATPPNCFPILPQANLHMYPPVVSDHHQDQDVSSTVDHHHHHHHHQESNSSSDHSHSNSLLYSLSLLKEKVHQVQSMVSILIAPDQTLAAESTASMAVANVGPLIQEIIVTASSMMFTCQQMASSAAAATTHHNDIIHHSTTTNSSHDHLQLHKVPRVKAQDDTVLSQEVTNFGVTSNREIGQQQRGQTYFSTETSMYHDWYNSDNYNNSNITSSNSRVLVETSGGKGGEGTFPSPQNDDKSIYDNIIELDASDLLAKYTHYCQVCGKGFKRDANLRMHMRAHGDEYKTSAALSNPLKNNSNTTTNGGGAGGGDHQGINSNNNSTKSGRKYSCPQEGCRWNRKHVKFQPLKSMVCVKNHYKRSHCPKMYVCKRCNTKQFSVLSDLRTHEKHCGDVKWQCSCGTTFSRKDKLMGHVALFVGHSPARTSTTGSTSSLTKLQGKVENE